MTTPSIAATLDAPRRRNRPLGAARIQLVNLPLQLGMPWLILGSAFVVNLVIFSLVPEDPTGTRFTGGLASIYIFVLVGYLITMTQVFPFALGLSVTRRDFFLGTSLLIVAESVVQGILLCILLAIERATGGWGIDMDFFGLPYLAQDNWFTQWLVYTVPFLLMAFVAILAGTIYKRFGQAGMWITTIGLILAGGTAGILLTWLDGWAAIGRFFAGSSAPALLAGYPAVLAALAAGAGYLLLRRATP